ncbi:hypothetical protein Nmel_009758, partial [Mimus melanotis]
NRQRHHSSASLAASPPPGPAAGTSTPSSSARSSAAAAAAAPLSPPSAAFSCAAVSHLSLLLAPAPAMTGHRGAVTAALGSGIRDPSAALAPRPAAPPSRDSRGTGALPAARAPLPTPPLPSPDTTLLFLRPCPPSALPARRCAPRAAATRNVAARRPETSCSCRGPGTRRAHLGRPAAPRQRNSFVTEPCQQRSGRPCILAKRVPPGSGGGGFEGKEQLQGTWEAPLMLRAGGSVLAASKRPCWGCRAAPGSGTSSAPRGVRGAPRYQRSAACALPPGENACGCELPCFTHQSAVLNLNK